MERPRSDANPSLKPIAALPSAAVAVKPQSAPKAAAAPHPPLPLISPPLIAPPPLAAEPVRSVGPSVRLEYEIWHPGLPKSPWFHTEKFVLSVNDQPEGDDGMNDGEERSSLDFHRLDVRRPAV